MDIFGLLLIPISGHTARNGTITLQFANCGRRIHKCKKEIILFSTLRKLLPSVKQNTICVVTCCSICVYIQNGWPFFHALIFFTLTNQYVYRFEEPKQLLIYKYFCNEIKLCQYDVQNVFCRIGVRACPDGILLAKDPLDYDSDWWFLFTNWLVLFVWTIIQFLIQ